MDDKTNIPVISKKEPENICVECGSELEIVFMNETDKYGIKTGYRIIDYIGCPKCLTNIVVDTDYLRQKP